MAARVKQRNQCVGPAKIRPASRTAVSSFVLERKVWIGFALGLLALVLFGGMSYRSVVRLRSDVESVDHTHQVISSLRRLLSTVTDAEASERGFLITGDEAYLGPANSAVRVVNVNLSDLRNLTADNPAEQQHLEMLDPLVAARVSNIQEIIEARRSWGFGAAEAILVTGRGKAIQDQIRAILSEMEDVENAQLQARILRAQDSKVTSTTIILAGSALALGITLVGLYLLGKDFARAREADSGLRELTGQLETRVRERTAELRNANESLRTSEELQAVTLGSIGDGVITTDGNACVNYMNAEAERLTGWRSAEARGAALSIVFHIVDESKHETMEDPAASILRSGKAITLANHTLLVARDGRETPIADCGSPITDNHGKVLGVVLVFRNCTVQRQAEKSLRERLELQEQLAKVAASAPGVICSFQQWPDGRSCFPYASPSIEKMYGISPAELARDGRPVFQRMHADDIEHVRKTIAESAARLTLWRAEFRISGPDGTMK